MMNDDDDVVEQFLLFLTHAERSALIDLIIAAVTGQQVAEVYVDVAHATEITPYELLDLVVQATLVSTAPPNPKRLLEFRRPTNDDEEPK